MEETRIRTERAERSTVLEIFSIAAGAVVPFILYMAFGYGIRSAGICDIPFLRKLNSVMFTAFFPLMMFNNIYNMDVNGGLSLRFVAFAYISVLSTILLLVLLVPRFVKDRRQIPVVIQGVYRSNILLFAIPLTASLLGEGAVSLATALVVLVVPTYNITAVVLLEAYEGNGKSSPVKLALSILENPLILGVVTAGIMRGLHIVIPDIIMKVIRQYSDMSTPLALFILGGTLQFSSLRKNAKVITAVAALRLVIVPAIMLAIGTALGFGKVERFVVFTLFATPMATAAFPMAQAMGADADLAGELIVVTTTGAVISLFLWIMFMQYTGIL